MEFDKAKYKIYTWKHPMMLLWILFPPVFVYDLIMGERMSKIWLIDKTIDKSKFRGIVPCPHCGKLHDKRTWSNQNSTLYKNWFGLYCNNCGRVIPCLPNLTSIIILAITFPIWFWFKKTLKENWLKKQPERYVNLELIGVFTISGGKGWFLNGIGWGLFMYVTMIFFVPLIQRISIDWKSVLFGLPFWIIVGLIYGYATKSFTGRKSKKPII